MKIAKRIVTCVLSALMILAAVPAIPAQAIDSNTYVATGDVNMRSGPGTKYKIVVTVRKGSKVTVTDTKDAHWYKTTYKNKSGKTYKGYISSKWLKNVEEPKNDGDQKENPPTGAYQTTGDVYMRAKPSKNAKALTVVPAKSTVNVTDTSHGKWFKAAYKDKKGKKYKGYISNKYLKKKKESKKDSSEEYKTTCDVNMRKKADKKSKVVVVVPEKATVKVTNTSNKNWYKATYKNKKGKTFEGFICSKYLTKS